MTAFVNFGVIFSIFIVGLLAAELPSFFHPCPRSQLNYTECTKNLIEKSVDWITSDAAKDSYHIPSVEPTFIDVINIGKKNNSQTWLTEVYRNIKIYGLLHAMRMLNIDVDLDKRVIRYTTWNERVDLFADYKLDGHFFLLELHDTGRLNITFSNVTTSASIFFDMEERNGETYIKGTKYVMDVTPTKVIVNFENLFNGRKDFGDKMNEFLSDNWRTFGGKLKAALQKRCAAIFLEVFNSLTNSVAAKKIFPN